MQTILFIIPSFQIGGTNSAFNDLIKGIDYSRYNVDVLPIVCSGPNYDNVAKYCNIIGNRIEEKVSSDKVKGRKWSVKSIVINLKRLLYKLGIDISPLYFRHVSRRIKKQYDVVVAYQEGQASKFATYFKTEKRIGWVHCDYGVMLMTSKQRPDHKTYSQFDHIVCVSEFVRQSFVKALPELESKTSSLHNIFSLEGVLSKSEDEINDRRFINDGKHTIVSIGRVAPVKRFSCIPELASRMKSGGLAFRWYIIGDGQKSEVEQINAQIKKYNLQDDVILLGSKTNPYPYLKNADLLVSTSLSEACPCVFNEAFALNVPIASADFGSSNEFIKDGENGIIAPIEELAESIVKLFHDMEFYSALKAYEKDFEAENKKIVSVINDCLLAQ